MRRFRFELILAAVLAMLVGAFWVWQSPKGRLSASESARYVGEIVTQTPMTASEAAVFRAKMQTFAAADDGRPVAMVNLLRERDRVQQRPGLPAGYAATPLQANAYYERNATPILLRHGGLPLFAGEARSGAINGDDAWNRIVIVRWPDRRAFLQFLADPAYGPLYPYKMAAEDLNFFAVSADLAAPDPRPLVLIAGMLVFMAAAWIHAANRR